MLVTHLHLQFLSPRSAWIWRSKSPGGPFPASGRFQAGPECRNRRASTSSRSENQQRTSIRFADDLRMARSCAAGGESFRHCASGVPLCPPGAPSARAPSYVSGGLRPLAPRWLPRFSSGRGKRVLPVCYGRTTNVAAFAGWSLLLGSRLKHFGSSILAQGSRVKHFGSGQKQRDTQIGKFNFHRPRAH